MRWSGHGSLESLCGRRGEVRKDGKAAKEKMRCERSKAGEMKRSTVEL